MRPPYRRAIEKIARHDFKILFSSNGGLEIFKAFHFSLAEGLGSDTFA